MLGEEFRRYALGGRLKGQSLRPVFAKDQRFSPSRGGVGPRAARTLEAAGLVHVVERHRPFEQNLLLQKHRSGSLGCSPSATRLVIRLDSRFAAHGPPINTFPGAPDEA